jgi:hypothetical protein
MKVYEIQYKGNGLIRMWFGNGTKKGWCDYSVIGEDYGIGTCKYDEGKDEDIFADIHDWVEHHINVEIKIAVNKKPIKIGKVIKIRGDIMNFRKDKKIIDAYDLLQFIDNQGLSEYLGIGRITDIKVKGKAIIEHEAI